MPARSRHRARLPSGSPPRAPPPPREVLLSGEPRRAPDSDGGSDADSDLGPESPSQPAEVSGGRGLGWTGGGVGVLGAGSEGWSRGLRRGRAETVEGTRRVSSRMESGGNGGCWARGSRGGTPRRGLGALEGGTWSSEEMLLAVAMRDEEWEEQDPGAVIPGRLGEVVAVGRAETAWHGGGGDWEEEMSKQRTSLGDASVRSHEGDGSCGLGAFWLIYNGSF